MPEEEAAAARDRYDEDRYREDVFRAYANDAIRVTWEPKLCIHYGACLRFLPTVFRPSERPWVAVDAASPDEVADVVERCPTGALHHERLDGAPNETSSARIDVSVQRGGPLFVRGDVTIADHRGNPLRKDTRVALCRCGRSGNKPFCDGTHDSFLFR